MVALDLTTSHNLSQSDHYNAYPQWLRMELPPGCYAQLVNMNYVDLMGQIK